MNLDKIKAALLASYETDGGINHLDGVNLPSQESVNAIARDCMHLLFPGYFEESRIAKKDVPALVDLLRNRSYAEIRQRMYDKEPGSPWWAACRAELDLRNGQQLGEASLALSRTSEKMRASVQHFEQLADTLHQATKDIADLLRGTQEAGRRLEIAIYVAIGVTLVQFFNLVFEIFRKH